MPGWRSLLKECPEPMKSPLALFTVQCVWCVSVLGLDVSQQPKRTYVDVAYGPDVRHVVDFWAASGTGARPLIVYIHGGGWVTGDKTEKMPEFQPFLKRGISCAAINYRLTPTHPLPAPVMDAARAIQYLRSKAEEWNIEGSRIALMGPSAGACTSMWLLFHDDLADPKSADPVLRCSTRVCAAAALVGQTSIDPKEIEPWLGPNVLTHRMIYMAVGETRMEDAFLHYDRHHALYAEYSPIRHVDAKDPALFMTCSAEMDLPSRDAGHGIHHPMFGVKLKEVSDRVGHECHLLIPGVSKSQRYADATEFLLDKLLARP